MEKNTKIVLALMTGILLITGATAFVNDISSKNKMNQLSSGLQIDRSSMTIDKETPTKVSSNTEDNGFVGYVVKIEGDRMLVVSPDVKDFTSTGGMKNYYSAIWFGGLPSNIEVGMKVEVWAEGGQILESYPAQGKLERVSIITESQSNATNLSEAEAVKQAISSLDIPESHFAVVKEVEYDSSISEWTVYMLDDNRENVMPIKVSDKSSFKSNE